MKIRRSIFLGMMSCLGFTVPSLIAADEILFEETFNDDGDGTRYITEGRFVSELDDHAANGVSADQVGPVYWAPSFDVSLVGVPGPTAERRAVIAWHHTLTPEQVTAEARSMIEATIAWLTRDKANLRVLFSPAPLGEGDEMIVDMITSKGGTVAPDEDTAGPLPAAADYDLVIHSSQGSTPSRFTNFPVPYLTYNGPDHDDELVGTIGLSLTQPFPDISVDAPEHPAAGGVMGPFEFFVGDVTVDAPGTGVPDGSTVVASYPIVDVPPVNSLADVEAMVAGTVETVVDEGTIPVADIEGGDSGSFSGEGGDNTAPGNPLGSFATVSTGSFNVKAPGTYGFALWVTGGARLRVDTDGNGLDAGDTVITQDAPLFVDGALQGSTTYGDITFATSGDYDFEWVAYSPTDVFGAEVYFTFVEGAGQTDPVDDQEKWAPLADWESAGINILPINLNGEIAVTKYEQPSQVIEERPLIIAINGPDEGGQVFGGGAFIDFEGEGFWAGSALNKFLAEVDPKTLTFNPVDVTGQTNLKLKVLLAATTLDFETSDLLDIKIDPNNSGTFQNLIHFTAPSGNDKFFSDGTTDLNIAFQEVTYDLPDGMTNLVIRIEAVTTWWNEVVAIDHIRVVREVEPEFTELWLLGDAGNGNQSEFSQEQGMDTAPGSATAQDDDFYFHGIYPDPIGTVTASEPFTNYDRAHVPSDPFNRIHFNLDADSAAADTLLRMTFALCCYGAADNGPSEHDMVFRLNGKEFFSENGINSDRVIQETVTAGDFNVTAGANTIEIERTGGSASSWVQYDYVRLEATAGEPVPAPGGGGGELPAGAHPLDAVSTGDGLSAYYWNLPPVTMLTVNEPLHRAGDGPAGADNSNSGWADENVYNALAPTGTFSATTFDYQGNDLTPINEWLGGDAAGYSGGDGNLGDGVFRFVGYVRVEEAGNRTFTTTSDDGSVVYVNDQLVISNDNGHGNQTVSANVNFPAPGYYPIDVRYFNGDWTNEAGEHGGANFIGEAGFTGVVQGLDGVDPLYTPPTGGGGTSLDLLFLGANDAPDAGADANVAAFLEARFGPIRYMNSGATDGTETADVIVMSSTFGSGSVRGKFHNSAVPIVNWEEAIMDANTAGEFGQSVAVMTKSTDTTQMALGNHPIAGDLGGTTIEYLTAAGAETLGSGELSEGTTAVGTAVGGAIDGMAMLFVTDTGGAVAEGAGVNGNVSPARRVAFPMTDATFDSLTDAGKELLANSILWAAGQLGGGAAPASLVGYWPADEGEGTTVADASGNGLDGTLVNGTWGAGIAGNAVDLTGEDGGTSHVVVPPSGKTFEQITIAGWINGAPTGDWTGIIQARGGAAPDQPIGIGFRGGTGNLTYTWNDNDGNTWDFDSGLAIPPNEWAFVAIALTPEGATLYVGADGELNASTNAIPHLTQMNANTSWYFGKDNCCGDARNFDGLMDEIAIWDVALAESELLALFNGSETPLTLQPGGGGEPGERPFVMMGVGFAANGAFTATLPAGVTADIEYSTDLIDWEVIATGVSGTVVETDPTRLAAPEGYYRGR